MCVDDDALPVSSDPHGSGELQPACEEVTV
jgi:hypothetical protein